MHKEFLQGQERNTKVRAEYEFTSLYIENSLCHENTTHTNNLFRFYHIFTYVIMGLLGMNYVCLKRRPLVQWADQGKLGERIHGHQAS